MVGKPPKKNRVAYNGLPGEKGLSQDNSTSQTAANRKLQKRTEPGQASRQDRFSVRLTGT
jgi:hypothetical protein